MVFNWFRRGYNKSNASEEKDAPSTDAPSTDSPSDQETAADSAEAEPVAPSAAGAAPISSQDYLQWAKAAYQNIQQQQGQAPTTADTAADTESPSEPEASEPETSEPEVSEPEVTADPPAPEPVTVDSTSAAVEPEAKAVVEPATETEPEAAEPEVRAETVEPEATETKPEVAEPEVGAEAVEPEPAAIEPAPPAEVDPAPAAAAIDSSEPEPEPEPEPARPAGPAWAQANTERLERLERLRETATPEPEPEPEPEPTVQPEPVFTLEDLNLDDAFLWSAEVLAAQGRRPDDISAEEITWLNQLRQGLSKTRLGLVNQLKGIVGQGPLNDDAVLEIEALLLQADVGVDATDAVIEALQDRMREEILPPDQAIAYLKSILRNMLEAPLADDHNLGFVPEKDQLNIWLMTGVNGAGKTTTIGKLAHVATKSGYRCLIAAADTFRAAAVEQVKAWGARSDVEVIANPGQNTDPAAVVYDAIAAAQSRNVELLLVDTAGRLQNKKNLMAELAKIRRIVDKKAPHAHIEALLVLDATLGQNGLRQAQVFAEAANLSGVVLTKLDGTAKGGVALGVVKQLGLPIRFIGAGEGIEDLRPFSSYEFVEALISG